jgi:hypothetical protein
MSEEREKPGVAFWAAVVIAVVLIGYPLSLLPLAWLDSRDMIPEQESIIGVIVWMYCAPARWLVQNGPAWIGDSYDWAFGN